LPDRKLLLSACSECDDVRGICPLCIAEGMEFARVYSEFLDEPTGEGH
jgi:uncharacterized protein CbrC (UPF0167 family)